MNAIKDNFYKFVFIYFLALQTIALSGAPALLEVPLNVSGIRLYPLDFGMIAGLLCVAVGYLQMKKVFDDPNVVILLIILAYFLYQILVILPLSLGSASHMSLQNLLRALVRRLYVLMIPFFYWFVIPAFREIGSMFKLIQVSSLFPVGFALYGLSVGIVGYTDLGELRLLWGGASILYAFVLFISMRFFSHTKTSVLFTLVGGIGLVLPNHRSAYVVMACLTFLAFVLSEPGSRKVRNVVNLFVMLLLVLGVIMSVPSLGESLISRLSTALDTDDPHAIDRFTRWSLSWSYFLSNPINGSWLRYEYYAETVPNDYGPHNFVLEILVTEGIVGMAFYATLLGIIIRTGLRYRWDESSWQMLLGVLFYIGFSLFNANFLAERIILLLIIPCSVIMYRRKVLSESEDSLVQ